MSQKFTVKVTTTLNEIYNLGAHYSNREDAQKMARFIRLQGWEQGQRASVKEVKVIEVVNA